MSHTSWWNKAKLKLEETNKYFVVPILALLTGIVGLYTNMAKTEMEEKLTAVSVETAKIESAAKSLEAQIAEQEFKSDLKIQMYGEVKEAISDTNVKRQKAVLLLVNEMLADDSVFREQLITILLASSEIDASVKEEQNKREIRNRRFEEQLLDSFPVFTIDVFYSEDWAKTSTTKAEKVSKLLKEKYPGYAIRLRCLPREINARKGFRFGSDEIRYSKKDSVLAAGIQKELIQAKLISEDSLKLKEGIGPRNAEGPKNYMSLFIRKTYSK